MPTIRIRHWRLDLVAPVHLRRTSPPRPQPASPPPDRIHRDPTPTPGALEPPVELFREIARGGRALD